DIIPTSWAVPRRPRRQGGIQMTRTKTNVVVVSLGVALCVLAGCTSSPPPSAAHVDRRLDRDRAADG
ncbi:hypothetical protein, partial [Salinispora arenicola]|uniref:hypothetical protein n=1 Tax=Salinispora arenicola TaxID=168697 RepID=UPI0027DCA0A0